MRASQSIGSQQTDGVAWCRAGLCSNIILSVFIAVALMASSIHLLAQPSKTGTASLAVQVSPAVQLTTNGTSNVSLWIRLGTSNGYLWGDGTNSCDSPIGTATTYTASGEYNNIPLTGVPFGSSNTYVCAYDPGAAIASVYLLWPHTDASLKFSTQPTNAASGASISPAVSVQVLDSNGLVDTTSTATVSLAIGTNPGGGTLGGTTSVAAVAGVATFSNLSINNGGTGYTLTASISSPSLSVTSNPFNITGGALDHFKVEKSGGGAIGTQAAGTAFSLRITAQDVNNNTVTSFTSTATLTSNGALTGSPVTTGNFVAGVLDPQSVTITNTGSFAITATASSKTGTSAAFTVNPGTAAKLAFTTQPSGGAGGTAWTTQPAVTLEDANGNAVTGTAQNVTLAIQNNAGPGGVLSGMTIATVNTTNGLATFSGLSINTKGTGYTLTASGSTVDTGPGVVVSNAFNVTVGPAAQLIFTTEPVGGIYASPLPTQPVVTVEDAGGNTVTTSSASVLLTPSSSSLSGCTNPLAATSGVATFSGCKISTAANGYTLTATSGTLTQAISSPFNVTSSPAGLSAPTVGAQTPNPVPAGSSATYGGTNGITVSISPASACTATMSIAGLPSGATGTFSPNPVVFDTQSSLSSTLTVTTSATTPVGTSSGVNVSATGSNGCSGTYTRTVTFVVSAGPGNAANSTVSASPTSVIANASTTSAITVTLKDANNNLVSGKTVTLAAGSGSSTITTVSGTTNSSGQASFTVKDSIAETVIYTATDTTDSVTITQKATVTFTASTLAITSVNGGSNPTAGVAFSVVVQAQDASGNPANVVANTGVTLSRNAGTGTLGGTLTGTITAGTNSATISGVTYTKAESGVVLTATRSSGDSLTAGNSAAFTVNPSAVSASVSSVNSSPASVIADGATTSTITVTLLDANSNPVSGKTVTLAQGAGSSTISAPSGPSNSSGVVTFTVTDTKAQAVTYTATDSTDSIAITDTAIVTFTASRLAFTTSSFSVAAGVCTSSAATVQTQDGNGTPTDPPSSVTVTLSSSSTGTKAFYSNSTCGTTITNLTIGTSANSANFWYKDTQAGSPVITATPNGGLAGTTQTETVNPGTPTAGNSTVTTSPASVPADGSTTSAITVTLKDTNNNLVSGKTVTLAAGSGSSTTTTVNGTTNASGQATFTVKDSTAQAVVYTGKDTTDNVTVSQTATVTFTASKLVFTTSTFTVTGGACSPKITVQTQDSSNNPTNPPSAVTVALSSTSTSGTGTFYSSSGCSSGSETSVSIGTGANSVSFYYKNTGTGQETITAAANGGVTSIPTQVEP